MNHIYLPVAATCNMPVVDEALASMSGNCGDAGSMDDIEDLMAKSGDVPVVRSSKHQVVPRARKKVGIACFQSITRVSLLLSLMIWSHIGPLEPW